MAERGPVPGYVIEIAADELERIDPALLPRIDQAWLHDHHRAIRRVPELLWRLPHLRSLALTDSRLNPQLFRRGLPESVIQLTIRGSGRYAPKGPAYPNLRLLDAMEREFFPRLDPAMFPNLEGLQVHIGRKSDKKNRRDMWQVIQSFPGLSALGFARADDDLDWSGLSPRLERLWLGNGDLKDLGKQEHMQALRFLHLHHLKDLTTLDGIEHLPNLSDVVLIGCDALKDVSALERMPRLGYLHGPTSRFRETFAHLVARGVTVQGWRG